MFGRLKTKESGLTLIELIVAVGLFGLLSVFVTGAFVNIISMQTQAESKQRIINDFRVALDLMGKELSEGGGFPDQEQGDSDIFFFSTLRYDMDQVTIEYILEDGRLKKAQTDTQNKCQIIKPPGAGEDARGEFNHDECFQPFTSEDVSVDDIQFYIHNFDSDDHYGYPLIAIAVSGHVDLPGVDPKFQTSVSYSPRRSVNPDSKVKADQVKPELKDIKVIDSEGEKPVSNQGQVIEVEDSSVDIKGGAIDKGGSGIKKLTIENKDTGDQRQKTYTVAENSGDPLKVDWDFEDLDLLTNMATNTIYISVTDHSDNSNNYEFYIKSTEAPEKPCTPESENVQIKCATDEVGKISEIGFDIKYDDPGGGPLPPNFGPIGLGGGGGSSCPDFDYYLIKRNDGFNGEDPLEKEVDEEDGGTTEFNDENHGSGFSPGSTIDYEIYAVTEVEDEAEGGREVRSDREDLEVFIPSDSCELKTPNLYDPSIHCSTPSDETGVNVDINAKKTDTEDDARLKTTRLEIKAYNEDGDVVASSTSPNSNNSYTWRHENIPQEDHTYTYKARECLIDGDDRECSGESNGKQITISDDTCIPSAASVFEPETDLSCDLHDLDGDGDLEPSIKATIGVEADDMEKPFDQFWVYECGGENDCSSRENIGSCEEAGRYAEMCAEKHYPRLEDGDADLAIHYAARTASKYGNNTYELGPLLGASSTDTHTMTIHSDMCQVSDWDDGPGGSGINVELKCNDEKVHDYRQMEIGIVDNYDDRDPASVYEVYRCDGSDEDDCEDDPLGTLSRSQVENGDKVIDYGDGDHGPEDNTTHWYGARICGPSGDCSGWNFNYDGVEPNECEPGTPQVHDVDMYYKDQCHHHKAERRTTKVKVELTDTADKINVYDEDHNYLYSFSDVRSYNEIKDPEGKDLKIDEEYAFYFEPCNSDLDEDHCGDKTEWEHTVGIQPCSVGLPEKRKFEVHCNEDSLIEKVSFEVYDSDYNDGYFVKEDENEICREEDPDSMSCEENFEPPISADSPKDRTYEARGFREPGIWDDTEEEVESNTRKFSTHLDSTEQCGAPFKVESDPSSVVIVTHGGTEKLNNDEQPPPEISLYEVATGFKKDVTISVSNTGRNDYIKELKTYFLPGYSDSYTIEPDYSDEPEFFVRIRDSEELYDYVDSQEDGSIKLEDFFEIKAKDEDSGWFETTTLDLIIRKYESPYQ